MGFGAVSERRELCLENVELEMNKIEREVFKIKKPKNKKIVQKNLITTRDLCLSQIFEKAEENKDDLEMISIYYGSIISEGNDSDLDEEIKNEAIQNRENILSSMKLLKAVLDSIETELKKER